MPQTNHDDGWNIWGKHVLLEIERLNDADDKQELKIDSLIRDVTVLKTEAQLAAARKGAWYGAIVGGIVSIGVSLILWWIIK